MKNLLIVDDKAPARAELRYLLRDVPGVRVASEASSLAGARAALATERIDLVFLDVNLLGEDGFDLVADILPPTVVVFVTAHAKFAPRARRLYAFGCLLKLIAPEQRADVFRRLDGVHPHPPQADLPTAGYAPSLPA